MRHRQLTPATLDAYRAWAKRQPVPPLEGDPGPPLTAVEQELAVLEDQADPETIDAYLSVAEEAA